MELALSLGETPKPFQFLDNPQNQNKMVAKDLGFCMALGNCSSEDGNMSKGSSSSTRDKDERRGSSSDQPVQLDLLPFSPVPRTQASSHLSFSWLTENLAVERGSSNEPGKRPDVSRQSLGAEKAGDDGIALSSPNSTTSSFRMDFSFYGNGRSNQRDLEANEADTDLRGASSRASDEEENGIARRKLRLTKEQSAFLEESFKEHSTLNPKQKLALARQLNLRPRQVEVWFQNRRARTKLKQTEVDCEYLRRCCETLTEENRRLQKELQELRALKSSQPFYMQLPATTLTMCPSCERVASNTTTITNNTATAAAPSMTDTALSLAKPRTVLFSPSQAHAPQAAS